MADNFYANYPISGSGGVDSLNGLSGSLTLVAGTGITLTPVGSSITIDSTGAGANTALSNVTGFTEGSVLFAGAGIVAQDNSNFFWDDANNRLGIGTATPLSAIHVKSDAATTVRIESISNSSSSIVSLRRARGTTGSETAVLAEDALGLISWRGLHSGGSYPSFSPATISASATQDWTATANGSRLAFLTTRDDTTTSKTRVTINHDGALRLFGDTSGRVSLYPAAVTTSYSLTLPSAQGAAGTVLTNDGAGALSWASAGAILVFTSNATVGGAASEALTVTGLLSTDTILSVTQKTGGGAALPLLGWSTQVDNGITGIWSADPGSGAVLLVAIKR